jgi:hypothetical protein
MQADGSDAVSSLERNLPVECTVTMYYTGRSCTGSARRRADDIVAA